jgi:hypothetical protein
MSARADSAPPSSAPTTTWRDVNADGLRHAQATAWPEAARAFAQAAQQLGADGKAVLKSRDMEARGAWGNAFALVLANLAQAEYQRGRLSAAITAAERALDVRLRTGAPDTRAVARVRGDLAVLLLAARRPADAARVLDDGLSATTDAAVRLTLLEHRARVALHARQAHDASTVAQQLREMRSTDGPASGNTSRLLAQLEALVTAAAQAAAADAALAVVEPTDAPDAPEAAALAMEGLEAEAAHDVAAPEALVMARAIEPAMEPVMEPAMELAVEAAMEPVLEPVSPAIEIEAIEIEAVEIEPTTYGGIDALSIDVAPLPIEPTVLDGDALVRPGHVDVAVSDAPSPALPVVTTATAALDEPFDIFPTPTPALGVPVVAAAAEPEPTTATPVRAPTSAEAAPVAFDLVGGGVGDAALELVGSVAETAPDVEAMSLLAPDAPGSDAVDVAPGATVALEGFGDLEPMVADPAVVEVTGKASRGDSAGLEPFAPGMTRSRTGPIDAVPPTAETRPHVMRSLEHFFDEFGRPQSGKSATIEDPTEAFDGMARVMLTPLPGVAPLVPQTPAAPEPTVPVEPPTADTVPPGPRTIALDDEIFGGTSFDIVVPTPPEPAARTTGSHDVGPDPLATPGIAVPSMVPMPPKGAPTNAALRPSMQLGFVVEHGLPTQLDYEAPPPPDVVLPAEGGAAYRPKAIVARDITMGNRRPDGSIVIHADPERATVPRGSAIIPDAVEPPGLAPRSAEAPPRRASVATPTGAPVAEVAVRRRRGGALAARSRPSASQRLLVAGAVLAAVAAAGWFLVLPALRG